MKLNTVIYNTYLFVNGFISMLKAIILYGPIKYFNKYRLTTTNNGSIAMVAIVKNEASYIVEWLEYHRIIGVDHFYIFDNGSEDNLKEKLKKYIDEGLVTYIFFPGKNMQERAYLDAVEKTKGKFEWLLTLDIDEFLEPMKNISLKYWLNRLNKNISQVEFGWMIYGSSGLKHREKGLVIERFKRHAKYSVVSEYKPIVRPEKVIGMSFPHQYKVVGKTIDENKKRIWFYRVTTKKGVKPAPRKIFRINHYYSKSLDEFIKKSQRGDASVYDREPRNLTDFKKHDLNDIFDDSMDVYIKKLKHICKDV